MIKRFLFSIPVILVVWLSACSSGESTYDAMDGLDSFTPTSFKEYVTTLSSDEFQGRKPFTVGETKTIAYLEEELKKLDVQPGNNSSYLQETPLMQITSNADSLMTVKSSKGNFQLKGYKDYVVWSRVADGASFDADELVYAGFGVVAPEHGWNDYEGLDVKGKVVLVFVNDPDFGTGDTTMFKGNAMTYYGRWTYKFEEAARQGAKGCLVIHDDVPASYPFGVVQNSWNTSKLYLDSRSSPQTTCAIEGWVSLPTAKKLMEAAGMNYVDKLSAAHKKGFKGEAMNLKVSTSIKTETVYNKSHNVVGVIPGTKRPDEYILYSAHWDHLGIGKPDQAGDTIYNGALDNASGSAGLLEIAKAFKGMKTPPERTVVFLFVTAEEQGLLGSAYYAQHPIFPKEKTVANINIDGVNINGKMKDIELVGVGQSDLEDYLKEACKSQNRYTSTDTSPEAGYYFRSDHFNFAKIGIPSLYTHSGTDHAEKGKDYGLELQADFRANRYHMPSDEVDAATWDLDAGIAELKLFFQVGKRLAFESTWPQWKPTSEFRSIREGYMPK